MAAWHTDPNQKKKKTMATLRELCNYVPSHIDRKAVEYELMRRKVISYRKRMDALCAEERVFDQCQQRRPQKGKYKNTASREQAGTLPAVTMGVRTGKYSVCVCKVKQF